MRIDGPLLFEVKRRNESALPSAQLSPSTPLTKLRKHAFVVQNYAKWTGAGISTAEDVL